MNGSLQYSALSRLLTLNNRVHDLQRQILAEPVTGPANRIAEMQEEIDQWSRLGLAVCWLSDVAADGDEGDDDEDLV